MIDPYAALGLAHNPFVAEPEPGVADHLWLDRGFSTPPEPRRRLLVQVLGPKGAGKTSLLLRWRACTGGPYQYVPPGAGRWRQLAVAPIAYWDEADRVPLPLLVLALLRARRAGATVAAGTHIDLAPAAAWCGLSVQTIQHPPLDAATLRAWADLRIAAARIPGAVTGLALDEATVTHIAAEAGASWRDAADRLHVWASDAARLVQL